MPIIKPRVALNVKMKNKEKKMNVEKNTKRSLLITENVAARVFKFDA